ncbi:MAG TPA: NUDIX hydrolase N-terminal domain-containing protein, partial [Bacteroidales bacterium]|nr:NUDIX hydrolase N-terminal domain-containing protein [Bacteroidales bacterium]
MRIVDTKGQLCPAPIIAAKRALKDTVAGESFVILTDNNTSYTNLAQSGLTFTQNPYDIDRYQKIRTLAVNILHEYTEIDHE